jgi:hypothetical protein
LMAFVVLFTACSCHVQELQLPAAAPSREKVVSPNFVTQEAQQLFSAASFAKSCVQCASGR